MAIVKWEPFGELSTLRRQMDHLMESFFGREPMIYGIYLRNYLQFIGHDFYIQ